LCRTPAQQKKKRPEEKLSRNIIAAKSSTTLAETSLFSTDRLYRKLVINLLAKIKFGYIELVDGSDVFRLGDPQSHLKCRIDVLATPFYRRIALGGSIGAGESFMDGQWKVDSLVTLVRIMAQNRATNLSMDNWWSRLLLPLHHFWHWFRSNTIAGSQKNIAAHYDLGNDFFSLFLDETMLYSCAVFADPSTDLHAASLAKMKKICDKLQLHPDDHLLEIGTGWGSLAIFAAKHYGCNVTTTTLSREQFDFTKERIRREGLGDKITLLLSDYRDLSGQFSKLVSIEMIEAVGIKFLPSYFRKCASLLRDDGLMVLQAITIADQNFSHAARNVDFIQRYIFPGGALPSLTEICRVTTKYSDLSVAHVEEFAAHYAQTLRLWRKRFFAKLDAVYQQGFDERFVRMWEFYLCYCEGGFLERAIGTKQIILAKPLFRGQHLHEKV